MNNTRVTIQEPNWQLMAFMVKNAGGITIARMSAALDIPENILNVMMRTDGHLYQPKRINGERLRRYALDGVLTAEQLEPCGVPFA